MSKGVDPILAALLPLAGVALGALLAGYTRFHLDRRNERRDARAAARLVALELTEAQAALLAVLADRKPNVPVPVPDLDVSAWRNHRLVLARVLTDDEWQAVERAYAATGEVRRHGLEMPAETVMPVLSEVGRGADAICKRWKLPRPGTYKW